MNFSEYHLIYTVYNTLCALAFLHEMNVMHRDIKSANMLVTLECDVKVCDFGLARTIPPNRTYANGESYNSLKVRSEANLNSETGSGYDMGFSKEAYIAHQLTTNM